MIRNGLRKPRKIIDTKGKAHECGGAGHLGGSDAVGRPLFALRNTPRPLVQTLREVFGKLESDKEFMAELKKVGADGADLLPAKDAEPVLRQVLKGTPGVHEFVKTITKKYLQR